MASEDAKRLIYESSDDENDRKTLSLLLQNRDKIRNRSSKSLSLKDAKSKNSESKLKKQDFTPIKRTPETKKAAIAKMKKKKTAGNDNMAPVISQPPEKQVKDTANSHSNPNHVRKRSGLQLNLDEQGDIPHPVEKKKARSVASGSGSDSMNSQYDISKEIVKQLKLFNHLQQEKAKLKQKEAERKEEKLELKIMQIDVDTLTGFKRMFYEKKQNEIKAKYGL